jgi:DNA-binding CsgD family transcriptional regulator
MSSSHLHPFFLAAILDRLTAKEKNLLRFIVQGKPMKSADVPDVSYKYNDKLLHGIRAKLGGVSKGRLIYHLGLLHILDHM